MKKAMELCRPCKEAMATEYELKEIIVGVNRKATCEGCNRRRYSSRYELRRKREERTA